MRRRELLGLLGGGIFGWSTGWAQGLLPTIGFLHQLSLTVMRSQVSAFWEGLSRNGFVEHRNVRVSYSWAEGSPERLQILAADLIKQGVTVLAIGGDVNSILAVKQVSTTVPIVFVTSDDPVRSRIIANSNQPESNVTGISLASTDLLAKRLEILHECIPQVARIMVLLNPASPNISVQLQYLAEAANRIGVSVDILNASTEAELQASLEEISHRKPLALLVANDGLLNSVKAILIAATSKNHIPAAFGNREFVEAGGLISYGPSMIDAYRQAGEYVARILKGEGLQDLPIGHPAEFEIAINRKTAHSLGLRLPTDLLSKADEVID